ISRANASTLWKQRVKRARKTRQEIKDQKTKRRRSPLPHHAPCRQRQALHHHHHPLHGVRRTNLLPGLLPPAPPDPSSRWICGRRRRVVVHSSITCLAGSLRRLAAPP